MAITLNGSTGITLPSGGTADTTGAVVGTTDTQTLTNKTITDPANAVYPASTPCFRAYASGVTSVTPSGNKVALAAKSFDMGGFFDSVTNSRFQPTIAGYYQFNGSVAYASTTFRVIAYLYKNGALYATGQADTGNVSNVADVVYLNGSTDYVELWAYSATTQNASASTEATYLSGFLVRAA